MAVNLIDSNDIQVAQTGNNIKLQIDDDIKNSITQNTSDIAGAQQDITNLENGNVYSTEETFTGKYWIDGKKIYRKVITGTTASTISTGITNAENFWIVFAFSRPSTASVPLGTAWSSSSYFRGYLSNRGATLNFQYNNWGGTFYAVVEYTKTTD